MSFQGGEPPMNFSRPKKNKKKNRYFLVSIGLYSPTQYFGSCLEEMITDGNYPSKKEVDQSIAKLIGGKPNVKMGIPQGITELTESDYSNWTN